MKQQTILLLEDDQNLADTIQELLQENGYIIDVAYDAQRAIDLSYENRYDMYIFDINVPVMNGFELLSSLRDADDTTPTIFISALADIDSITKGFNAGADDYIKKPFFPQELLIRVNAKFHKAQTVVMHKDIRYFPDSKDLFKNDVRLYLSDMLMQMLHIFLTNQNMVILKEELMECMEHPTSSALRVAINKLKQQTSLEIKNIRGTGYILESR